MKIKIQKLDANASIPQKATDKAAGYDLRLPKHTYIESGRQIVKLGFAIQLPDWHKAVVDPRSGFSSKGMEGYVNVKAGEGVIDFGEPQRLDCDVIHGLIDCDYRGECGVIVKNNEQFGFWLPAGTRIAQMVITKYEDAEFVEADELDDTERGTGGFGHTGAA